MYLAKSKVFACVALIAFTPNSINSAISKTNVGIGLVHPLTADQLADALIKQGLPIVDKIVFDARTDPNKLLGRPGGYSSKVSFRDERYIDSEEDSMYQHTIETFPTAAAAQSRKRYVDKVTNGVSFLMQYQFISGRILLRMDKVLTPDEATQYDTALQKIGR